MIYELFTQASELPLDEQAAFARLHCTDEKMLTALLSLLSSNQQSNEFTFSAGLSKASEQVLSQHLPAVGDAISVYQLTASLGQGGMGSVFKAIRADDAFEQAVAIKVIPPHIQSLLNTNNLSFSNEANLMAKLHHPHIRKIHDAGTLPSGMHYLVMELIEGSKLDDYLEHESTQNTLSLKARLTLFIKICHAVHHAHQHQVIHADIKAANILVDKHGEPHILDFGIAKLFDSPNQQVASYYQAFSPDYASPELIKTGQASTLCDVYSLGKLLALILGSENNKAEKLQPYSHELQAVVTKATEKDPNNRYPAVTEMRNDITQFLSGHIVSAFLPTTRYKIIKCLRLRHPIVSVLSLLSFIIISTFGVKVYNDQQAIQAQHQQQVLISNKLTSFLELLNPLKRNSKNFDEQAVLASITHSLENDNALSALSKAKLMLTLAETNSDSNNNGSAEKLYIEVINNYPMHQDNNLRYNAASQLAEMYSLQKEYKKIIIELSSLAKKISVGNANSFDEAMFYYHFLGAELNEKYVNLSGEGFLLKIKQLEYIIQTFNEQIPDKKRADIWLLLGLDYYNQLPFSFGATYIQVTKEQFEQTHKPQLLKAVTILSQAQQYAKEQQQFTIEAKIQIYRANIYAELGQDVAAQQHLAMAAQTLTSTLTPDHPEMKSLYIGIYQVNFLKNPQKALRALKNELTISTSRQNSSTDEILFNLFYLAFHLFSMGENEQAMAIYEHINPIALNIKLEQASSGGLGSFNALESGYLDFVESEFPYKKLIKKNQRDMPKTYDMKLSPESSIHPAYRNNPYARDNYINWRAYNLARYVPIETDSLYVFQSKIYALNNAWLRSFESHHAYNKDKPHANTEQVTQWLNAFTWSEVENDYSTYKIQAYLFAAEILIHNNTFEHAKPLLTEIARLLNNIPLLPNNAWQTRFTFVSAELAQKEGNKAEANTLLRSISEPMLKHFPENSIITTHYQALLKASM